MGFWDQDIVLTKNNLQVTVGVVKDEEDIQKTLVKLTPAKSSAKWETDTLSPTYGPNSTLIIDLLRLFRVITINGVVATGLGNGDTSTNASDKIKDFRNMIFAGGTMNMTYEGETLEVNIEKFKKVKTMKEGVEPSDGEEGFEVTFAAIVGVDI